MLRIDLFILLLLVFQKDGLMSSDAEKRLNEKSTGSRQFILFTNGARARLFLI
jgi:hypothetical protein